MAFDTAVAVVVGRTFGIAPGPLADIAAADVDAVGDAADAVDVDAAVIDVDAVAAEADAAVAVAASLEANDARGTKVGSGSLSKPAASGSQM